MLERRSATLAGLALALGLACGPGGPHDLLVERCTEVIHYRHPSLREIDVVGILREPGGGAVTLDFEALVEPSGAQVASRIACAFEPTDHWSLEGISIDGRALTEAEVALVNAEFLLRDLSQSPQRLDGSS